MRNAKKKKKKKNSLQISALTEKISLQKNGAGIVSEFEVKDITREGCEKASPEQFDLLRVLGQGSFGKVSQPPKVIRLMK